MTIKKPWFGSLLVLMICFGGAVSLDQINKIKLANSLDSEKSGLLSEKVLPGILPDQSIQLPNQWRLKPVGKQLEVGDFPVNLAIHPSGQYLAILHAGMREHEVVVMDLNRNKQKIVSRVTVDQTFYGICFTPNGKKLYLSGGEFEVVHEFDFDRGLLSNAKTIHLNGLTEKGVIGGISTDPKGQDLFVCATWGDAVIRIPIDNPDNHTVIPITREKLDLGTLNPQSGSKGEPPSPPDGRKDPEKKEIKTAPGKDSPVKKMPCHPYICLVPSSGKKAYVSLWSAAAIAVLDLETNRPVAFWKTEEHPTEMVLSPDEKVLYVACANSAEVSVLDTETGKPLQSLHSAMAPETTLPGSTPNSLTLTANGEILLVANADANQLAVFNVQNPKQAKPLGFIPVGWYPTSVRFNNRDKKIYVANGKGAIPKSNRSGPNPYNGRTPLQEYIGSIFRGSVSTIDFPTPKQLGVYTEQAYKLRPDTKSYAKEDNSIWKDNPIPRRLGEPSPIRHVFYIIKENRTYDQVFGDIPQGNGEKDLCLFPEAVTPNQHRLAKEFVLLDNFYVEGEVSADGHEWSMGAYATDFLEKYWPLSYRGSPKKRFGYPSEGQIDYAVRPKNGYIWDRCAQANVSYRTYGEWIDLGKKQKDGTYGPAVATVKALEGHFDPFYQPYDLSYPDVKRAQRFIGDFKRLEKENAIPQFTIIKLPNDHTAGTQFGKPTPTAFVADNDLALGMVVHAISHSSIWKDSAIFVLEDDAQNGPDHVDAHRSTALVISPYTKRKQVVSTLYSTTSMLRTMELILGLQPLSQFDAAARPMFDCFQAKADLTPFTYLQPKTDLNAKNLAGAFGSKWCETIDLSKEDMVDDLKFNEVIWKSVKGINSPIPAPVRSAFFLPK